MTMIPPSDTNAMSPRLPGPVQATEDDSPFTWHRGPTGSTQLPNKEWGDRHGYVWDAARQRWRPRTPGDDMGYRQSELERQKSEMELEQMRWMFTQMRNNPYGMNIRDLIYGRKGSNA